jgi:hypothetical protein
MKRLSLALAAMLVAGGVHASPVSFEFGLPITEVTTEISQTGALGLFDTNLGTLTGVSLTVFGSATFSFTVTNNAAQAQLAEVTARTRLFWSSDLAALNPFLTDIISLQLSSGPQVFAAGSSQSFGPSTQTGQFTDDLISIGGALSAAGGGTFNLTCNSLSGLIVDGGGGNLSIPQSTQAGCGARITYTFTPPPPPPPPGVPEPASLALVGLALAGAGFASRRRRQA